MKNFKMNIIISSLLMIFAFSATGCSNEISEKSESADISSTTEEIEVTLDQQIESTELTTEKAEEIEETKETEGNIVQEETTGAEYETNNNSIYADVLNDIYNNHAFPDGIDYGYNESYNISENKFAIYDIDYDGSDELIVSYTTTYSAGMCEFIFDVDDSGNIVKEFVEFPMFTYYDNGIIEVGLSHNQSLSTKFWPYTMYQYDANSDTYIKIGGVEAWDKALKDTDYPDDIDISNSGSVYYIIKNDVPNDVPVDITKYNEWHESYIGGAKRIDIPYLNLTEENIQSIK